MKKQEFINEKTHVERPCGSVICVPYRNFKTGIRQGSFQYRIIKSNFKVFSVSLDELLSGEEILKIADEDDKQKLRGSEHAAGNSFAGPHAKPVSE